MKELLYIPSGRYVRFVENNGMCIEKFMEYRFSNGFSRYTTVDEILEGLCEGDWNELVYASAEIDNTKPILPYEFEIVNV